MKAVLENRLQRFLTFEAKRLEEEVEEVLFVERKFDDVIPLPTGPVRFSYRVDRVDRLKDGTVMILDYKTGGSDAMPKSFAWEGPLSRANVYKQMASVQMPLYLYYLDKQYPTLKVNAALYHLRTMDMDPFIISKTNIPRQELIACFLQALAYIMVEIFNPEIPFLDEPLDIK